MDLDSDHCYLCHNYTETMIDDILITLKNYSNISTDIIMDVQNFQIPNWVFPFMLTIYACIFMVGVTGNVLVILVIAKDRRMRNTANFYLISLSIADLMIIVCCLPVAAYEMYTDEVWNLGPILCRLAPLLQYLSTNASICTMVAISIERYVVICRPFKVRAYCTKRRAVGIIILLWAFSFICSFPVLIFTYHGTDFHFLLGTNVTVCYIRHSGNDAYFFFHQAVFYLLPGIMLSLLYLKIIWTLKKFKCESFAHSPDSRRNAGPGGKSHADTSQQLILMLSAVVLCYFVCLLPYNTVTFLSLISSKALENLDPISYQILLAVSRIMFYVNSCSNPILYNAISGKFRNAFLRLFCPRRWKATARESRTFSMRSGDYDYDCGSMLNQRRSTSLIRRAAKKSRSGSDAIGREWTWEEQRELCSLQSCNGQRCSADKLIKKSRNSRERRMTELIISNAREYGIRSDDGNHCVLGAPMRNAELPLLSRRSPKEQVVTMERMVDGSRYS